MALAEKNNGSMSMIPQEESCNCTEKCEAGKVNTGCPVCKNDLNGCKGKEKPAETEKPAEPEKPKERNRQRRHDPCLSLLPYLRSAGSVTM